MSSKELVVYRYNPYRDTKSVIRHFRLKSFKDKILKATMAMHREVFMSVIFGKPNRSN